MFWTIFIYNKALYIFRNSLSLFLSLPISFSFTLLSRSAFLSLPSKTRSLSHLFLLISTHIRARFFSSLSLPLSLLAILFVVFDDNAMMFFAQQHFYYSLLLLNNFRLCPIDRDSIAMCSPPTAPYCRSTPFRGTCTTWYP